jgi:hypothetical protein
MFRPEGLKSNHPLPYDLVGCLFSLDGARAPKVDRAVGESIHEGSSRLAPDLQVAGAPRFLPGVSRG